MLTQIEYAYIDFRVFSDFIGLSTSFRLLKVLKPEDQHIVHFQKVSNDTPSFSSKQAMFNLFI